MIRLIALLLFLALPAQAQNFGALARVDMAQSQVRDDGSALVVDLSLSQPVPYRVFTLNDPRRVVIDFKEVDWTGVSRSALLNADGASDLRFGRFQTGWSRMVVHLAGPMQVAAAGMAVDTDTGRAMLQVRLTPTEAAEFAERAGASPSSAWPEPPQTALPPLAPDSDLLTVVIDPGHGGIDPGAERGGVSEAPLMLQLARDVTEALTRTGEVRVVLTRQDDSFVSLSSRMTIARSVNADLMISLHADALEEDAAVGASVYTLSEDDGDDASRRMAERHNRSDLLAGLDLSDHDDRIARVLMDMARRDTAPASDSFAQTLVAALRDSGARVNSNPRRSAELAVLMAADFPAVLLEAGFLSNPRDRDALTSAEGRARIAGAIADAVLTWAADEALIAPLRRR